MDAIAVLKETCEAAGLTFVFADIYSANLGIDKISQFPCFVYIAPQRIQNTLGVTSTIKRKISVLGFVLFKQEGEVSLDFDHANIDTYVAAARKKVDNIVYRLNKHAVTDKETDGIVAWQTNATYSKFDGHLYGCQLDMEWPVDEDTNGYQ